MALDSDDLASLSTAIQDAITNGFANAFPRGKSPNTGGSSSPSGRATAAAVTPPSNVNQQALDIPEIEIDTVKTEVNVARTFTDRLTEAATNGLSISEVALDKLLEIQGKAAIQNYRNLIRGYSGDIRKITSEQFLKRDFSNIVNEGDRTVVASYRNFKEIADEFFEYEGLEFEEALRLKTDLLNNFGDVSSNLFNKNTQAIERESLRFSNSMGVDIETVSDLIANSFAQTGEASTDVLMDITKNAKAMGKAVGVPLKRMSEAIIDIKKDMETFTDITVESAARMAGSLSQLGLSLQSFSGLVKGFRSFDQAADKMGELSAVFGVQMDAMEMMYLANENEEEFLNRFREQIIDQGIDVASMSKTRQRALADQLGMSVREMKMFMDTGTRMTSQAEKEIATQEAASQTSSDAIDTLNEGMVKVARTTEEIQSHIQNIQGMFSGISASKMLESVAAVEGKMARLATGDNAIAQGMIKMQETIATMGEWSAKFAEDLVTKLLPDADKSGVNASWQSFGNEFKSAAETTINDLGAAASGMISNSPLTPGSWPAAFLPIANGLGADKDGKPNENMQLYVNTIRQWGTTLSEEIAQAINKIETSFNFEGIKSKFQSAAQLGDVKIAMPAISETAPQSPSSAQLVKTTAISNETSSLNKELLKSISKISDKVESMPTEVNVKVDVEAMKSDIVNAINEGFGSAKYGFNLTIDGTSIANSLTMVKDKSGRTIQFIG